MTRGRLVREVARAYAACTEAFALARAQSTGERLMRAPVLDRVGVVLAHAGSIERLLSLVAERRDLDEAPGIAEVHLAVNVRGYLREAASALSGLAAVVPVGQRGTAEDKALALLPLLDAFDALLRRSETMAAVLNGASTRDPHGLEEVAPELVALLVHVGTLPASTASAVLGFASMPRMRAAAARLHALSDGRLAYQEALRALGHIFAM